MKTEAFIDRHSIEQTIDIAKANRAKLMRRKTSSYKVVHWGGVTALITFTLAVMSSHLHLWH